MKKIIVLAAAAFLAIGSMVAQNTFRGTIKYTATSTGETEFQIPEQVATAEIKVYDSKVITSSPIFLSSAMFASNILVDGRTQYVCMDLSQLMMIFSQMDVELDYSGSSKILVTNELTQQDIDSLTIPVTEGFYVEYVDESKTIAGKTAKKAILHSFNEDGEDNSNVIWYCEDMGPEVNPIFGYVKGVAMEYKMQLGEGREITLTATEVKSGKVKEVDLLLPSGYEQLSKEAANALFEQIGEELRYLQEE